MNNIFTPSSTMKFGKKLICFSIFAFVIFSCKNSNETEKVILKSNLQALLIDNQELVNELKIKKNGSASVEPYYNLAYLLNNEIRKFCDTSVLFNEYKGEDAINKLNARYLAIFDSVKKSYNFKLFLPVDDSLIINTEFKEIKVNSFDEKINQYLTSEDVILKSRKVIRSLQYCISVCYLWYTKFDDLGYSVNVIKSDDVFNIAIHYDYPKRYAEYNLIGLERLESTDKKNIQIKNLNTTKNDTLIFSINGYNQSNLKAFVKYKVIKCTGELDTINVEIPFSLK